MCTTAIAHLTPDLVLAGDLSHYTGPQHAAHGQLKDPANYVHIESDLTLLGFAGLMDPPRPEVRDAVRDCQQAGIRVSLHPPWPSHCYEVLGHHCTGSSLLNISFVIEELAIFHA